MSLRDTFAAHGIDHLSASSLNTWSHQPSLWLMERLLGKGAPVGVAAHRGSAIEAGVTLGLLYPDAPVEQCQKVAIDKYSSLTAFSINDPKREQEGEAVAPTVAVALAELRQYGFPDEVQLKIERQLIEDELPPLIGYLDYGWSRHGIVVDLKTQLRLASESTASHERQVAAYVHGTNRQGRLCYATPKKCGVYIVENVAVRFAELVLIALSLGRFLSVSKDPQELAGLLTPDTDHWMWNNATAKANRKEVYGL